MATDAVPTLVEIAQEFRPDSGRSLREVIEKMGSDISMMRQAQMSLQAQVQSTRSAVERGAEEVKAVVVEQVAAANPPPNGTP